MKSTIMRKYGVKTFSVHAGHAGIFCKLIILNTITQLFCLRSETDWE